MLFRSCSLGKEVPSGAPTSCTYFCKPGLVCIFGSRTFSGHPKRPVLAGDSAPETHVNCDSEAFEREQQPRISASASVRAKQLASTNGQRVAGTSFCWPVERSVRRPCFGGTSSGGQLQLLGNAGKECQAPGNGCNTRLGGWGLLATAFASHARQAVQERQSRHTVAFGWSERAS